MLYPCVLSKQFCNIVILAGVATGTLQLALEDCQTPDINHCQTLLFPPLFTNLFTGLILPHPPPQVTHPHPVPSHHQAAHHQEQPQHGAALPG